MTFYVKTGLLRLRIIRCCLWAKKYEFVLVFVLYLATVFDATPQNLSSDKRENRIFPDHVVETFASFATDLKQYVYFREKEIIITKLSNLGMPDGTLVGLVLFSFNSDEYYVSDE